MRVRRHSFVWAAAVGAALVATLTAGAVSPPRGTLAYVLTGKEIPSARSWIVAWDIRRAGTRRLTPLPRAKEQRWDYRPSWSPNGGLLAFVRVSPSASGVYVVGADGKGLRRVVALSRGNAENGLNFVGPVWSPDGAWIAFDRHGADECSGSTPFRHRITIARVDGTRVADIPVLPNAMKYRALFGVLSWSPDGTKLLYSVVEGEYDDESPGACRFHGPEPSELYTVGVNGRGLRLLASQEAEFDAAAWSPDGRSVAYSSCRQEDMAGVVCDLAAVSADARTHRVIGRHLDEDGIAWSRNGREVIANLDHALVAVDAATGSRRPLGAEGEILGVAGDGRHVAVWGAGDLRLEPLARGASRVVLHRPALPAGARDLEESDLFIR